MTILEKNIQALLSGVNEPLGNKLLNFIQNKTCSCFNIDENLNIYDKTHNVFMYENLEEELNFFYQSILEKTPRYPFVCIYGIGNALLIKNLAKHYKHLFVFESEIELFILALSMLDLSEELCSGKIYLVDVKEEKVNIQLSILFDQKDMFGYLSLYEMFINCSYYEKYFIEEIKKIDRVINDNMNLVIRNLDPECKLSLICYDNFIQNIPLMLKSIPFQRIIQERKNQFENCIVVCAGPSLEKQIPLLKKYQENFVIFCADGAFPLLYKNDIIPDYVLNLDYEEHPIEFFKNIDINKLEKTLFILGQNTFPSIINFLKSKNLSVCIVLNQNFNDYRFIFHDFGYLDIGTHVGHMCYTLALTLGFKNIIIIGQDLAYSKEGNSHFSDFALGENIDHILNIPSLKTLAYGGVGEVMTHIGWDDYRKKLEFLFSNYIYINFYNATEGGARIAFTKELSFKECCLKFANEKKKILEIPKTFTLNRSNKLLNKILEYFDKNLKIINLVLEDAQFLYNALDKILIKQEKLPLKILYNFNETMEDFITSINEKLCFFERIQKGLLSYKEFELSQIIAQKIKKDEEYFILIFIAYKKWLIFFIEKIEIEKGILQKLVKNF
ncbi:MULTISPECIES: motility associated factor glycosyltransferase family protein [Campylobacter]|uniref:motility associated factor glycosyltransferase family protein n=1 Tax=Campylobacter TaxID=194 RepID=UPI000873B1E5|nr:MULTISPECIES: motility associated factor glycosyltransferase family protein [Campylobacter]EAL2420633.1 motility associated factor glycosyltransferase family protein [Campylobacter jejuni]EJQ2688103.1 motility associated factor glycosyltransferase family protein [Campylobacter jejuni]OEW23824.1 motility accessory factor [Campylobacter sp. BCW_6889]OEW28106.1 motility accessory factor [Campylobacter jejuni]